MKTRNVLIATLLLTMFAYNAQGQIFRRGNRSIPVVQTRTPQEIKLIQTIKQQQQMHVGDSWGTQDWQCFTDQEYRMFKAQNVPGWITSQLRKDEAFITLVAEIRKMDVRQRNSMLARAARTYKPTWRQQGHISRSGQTVAGQLAERDIAVAIVRLVKEMLQGNN